MYDRNVNSFGLLLGHITSKGSNDVWIMWIEYTLKASLKLHDIHVCPLVRTIHYLGCGFKFSVFTQDAGFKTSKHLKENYYWQIGINICMAIPAWLKEATCQQVVNPLNLANSLIHVQYFIWRFSNLKFNNDILFWLNYLFVLVFVKIKNMRWEIYVGDHVTM